MKKNFEIVLGSILLIISIALLLDIDFNSTENDVSDIQILDEPYEKLDKELLLSHEITAVFEINDKPCPPCLVNIDEYIKLIEADIVTDRIIIRFFTEAELPKDSERIIKLRNWDSIKTEFYTDTIMVENKLMIFQNEESYTLSLISNGILTSISEKKSILEQHKNQLEL